MARKIGRYDIYEKIGSGAFGEVYRGHDPEVNRPVAVKVLSALSDADNLTRFRREAAAAGNLNHPNIVTIYDSGENEGVPFIVMQLVDGTDLQKVTATRKLSLLEKAEIMYQVAEGLQYAHNHDIVHRDVKPANIMVLPDGSVKILDFGIARFKQQAERHTRAGFMVGTILYMSPEQFQDGQVDALCDIWAYGVVYYELLTGKHPFEAKDNAGLMYKVTRVDPPRIRALAADVPEGLEQLVLRSLARDRELRYQSLDDLQLDALPVLMELRRQRASALISDARASFEARQLDEAMATVRRILDLDPGMIEARQLRDQIAKQMQQFKVRPKVDALLKSAEQEIGERRFGEAVESLESALRLDQADTGIRVRLEEAKRLADMSTRAAELVMQAEREFRLRLFPSALRLCAEALRVDEHHPQANRLMEAIQQEMTRQEKQRRREEALEKARGLLTLQSFDELFASIDSMRAEFPGDPQVEQFAAIARSRHQERTRRDRLNEEMQAARGLLRERRFAEAVDRLNRLRADFAQDQQFIELLAFAEDELRRQMKEQEISDLVERSQQAQQQGRFDEALKLLDQGMQKYPGDGALIRQFQAVMNAKAAFEKAQAVTDTIRRGEDLIRQGRPAEALGLVENAVNRFGAEPALLKFRRDAELACQQLERDETIRTAVRQAEELLRKRQVAPAISAIQAALSRYPDSAELQALQDRAADAAVQEERRRFLEEHLARAGQLEHAQQWEAALAVIDYAQARFPDAGELAPVRARLEQGLRAAAAQRESAAYKLRVEQAISARDWDGAGRLLAEAQTRIPAADVAGLRQQVEAARNRAALDTLVADAQDRLAKGDLQGTREVVNAGLAQFGRQERLLRLQQILDRESAFRENLSAAKKAVAEQRFGPAVEFLRKALEINPTDHDARALLDVIEAERQKEERARTVAAGKERVLAFCRDKQYDRALKELEPLLALSPEDAELRTLLTQATRAKADAERERASQEEKRRREQQLAADVVQFDSMLHADQLDAATQVLERSKLVLGNDPRLAPLQQRLTVAFAVKQRREEVQRLCAEARDLMSRGRPDETLHLLEGAAVRFPDAPEFPALIAEAETARRDAQRRKTIEQTLASAAAMVENGQPEAALRSLDEKLRLYPDARELAEAATRLRSRLQVSARQRDITDTTQAIERLMSERKWAQALALCESGQQQYPDTPVFAGLKRSIENARRQADIEDVIAAVGAQRRERDLARAAETLAAGRARFPDEQRLHKLFFELEAAISDESIAQARPLIEAGNFEAAKALLHEALARRPNLPAAQELLKEIAGREAERLRQQRLRERAIETATGGQRSHKGMIFALVGIAVVAIGAVAWWKLRPEPQPKPKTPAPEILEKWDHPTATRGEPYAGTVHASGGSAPLTWSVVKGALPAGVELSSQTGLIEGVPSADGTFTFTAQILDHSGRSAQREFTITVRPPAIKNADAKLVVDNAGEQWSATRGANFSDYFRASGGTPPITWSISKRWLPRGLSLDPKNGHVRGAAAEDGTFNFTAKATDHAGHFAEGSFTITVKGKEQPPVSGPVILDSGVPASAVKGEHYTANLRATGGTATITWSVQNLPRGLILDPGSGRIEGAFPNDGSFSFVAKATDRAGRTGERAFTITVKTKDQPPPPPPACQVKPYDFNTYGDLAGGTLTWSGMLPAGGDLTINGRTVSAGSLRGGSDYLPADGAHIRVDIEPASVKVKEQPSTQNCWAPHLVLHNDGGAVSGITIRWRTIP